MQEIKKTRIVIASVLKPVDDTRMFEKIGSSLAQTEGYDVHIIGYPTIRSYKNPSVVFHPLPFFKRLSLYRIFAPWVIVRRIMQLRPDLLIITTHELLGVALLIKAIHSCKVIYDIRENYFRNIFYTRTFPFGIRHLIASHVRLKEIISFFFIDHFLLAEKGYEREIPFLSDRKTVIENKLRIQAGTRERRRKDNGKINLLFSGTWAETTGVFKAIEIAEALHMLDEAIHLTLIGYCAQSVTLDKIRKRVQGRTFIELIGGDILVPHEDIIKEIQGSDFGIIAYPLHTSTMNSVPTKLYEYLGYSLPIILTNHPPWVDLCEPYQAAIAFDQREFEARTVLKAMKSRTFYTTKPTDAFWDNEEIKLRALVAGLLPRATPYP